MMVLPFLRSTAFINPPPLIGSESFVTPAVTPNVCDSVDDVESVTVAGEVAKTTTQILSAVCGDQENLRSKRYDRRHKDSQADN